MKYLRNCLFVLLIFFTSSLVAQKKVHFTLFGDISFDGHSVEYFKLIDLNNDGFDDLFTAYRVSSSNLVVKLYLNDKHGNFIKELSNPFKGMVNPAVDFGDIDNDGDIDIIMFGLTSLRSSNSYSTYLYENNGAGGFNISSISSIYDFKNGAVKFFDSDSDLDLDIIITGYAKGIGVACMIYMNNGKGVYQQKNDTVFIGVSNGDIGVSDVDNDGDFDLILSGISNQGNNPKSFLYVNDGSANFTRKLTNIESHTGGMISFSDIDKDGDEDLFTTGYGSGSSSVQGKSQLYLNDSLGNYHLDTSNLFFPNVYGTTTIIDIDNDGDNDVLFSGKGHSFSDETGLYINDGIGNFSLKNIPAFEHLGYSSDVSDIDNNGYLDIVIAGNGSQTSIFMNDSSNNFISRKGDHFVGVHEGVGVLEDINNDGLIDAIVSGSLGTPGEPSTNIYIRDSTFIFKESNQSIFDSLRRSALAVEDIDNDGDNDILIAGEMQNNLRVVSKLFINDGSGVFSLSTNNSFTGVRNGSIVFSDVDNDSDLDLLLQGVDSSYQNITELYLNDGQGVFTLSTINFFIKILPSKSIFFDFDNDNDLDLFISGTHKSLQQTTFVYLNNGFGRFTRDSINFTNISRDKVIDHVDFDNDGDEDLLVRNSFGYNELYWNDSTVRFSKTNSIFPGNLNFFSRVNGSDGKFFDVDNDGDQDLILAGGISGTSALYVNNDSGKLFLNDNQLFQKSSYGSVSVKDINNDGLEDLLIVGANGGNQPTSKIYINRTCNYQYDTINKIVCNSFLSPSGRIWDTSGIYVDTITAPNYCDSIITFNITVNQNDTIIVDSSNFFYSGAKGDLQWVSCNNNYQVMLGDTNQLFYPPNSGFFALIINQVGCIDTTSCYSKIVTSLNMLDNPIRDLKVFPNPAINQLSIVGFEGQIDSFSILDINGLIINKQNGNIRVINISALCVGFYYLRISTTEGVMYKKFVKLK